MYEKTVELNPWQVYRAAKVVLAEMIEEFDSLSRTAEVQRRTHLFNLIFDLAQILDDRGVTGAFK